MSAQSGRSEMPAHEAVLAGAPAASSAEQFVRRDKTPLERLHAALHRYEIGASVVVLVLAFAIFSLINGSTFLAASNQSLILQQVMIVGTLAIAQTLVILTAGIDLSVGVIMVFSSVVMGRLAIGAGFSPWLALICGIGVGALCGVLNGLLVTLTKLPPFIATLGTLFIFGSLIRYVSESETIGAQDLEADASLLQWTSNAFELGGYRITYGVVLMLVLFAVVWYALNWTAWGRHVYAVGNDAAAARLVGIRTDRVLLSVYVVAGIVCGIAAWILIGRIGSVSPQADPLYNLNSIAAVVIGGISLFGGRGSLIGAFIGALIVGIFTNGLALSGIDVLWQDFAIGVLILAAVAADGWIRRVKA